MELEVARKRCLDCLINSIEQLQGRSEPDRLEHIAELIILSMSGPWRYFHTPEHIFEVGGSIDPIEVLAALFHDLVYVQVDHGVNLNISTYISPFVQEQNGQLTIRELDSLPDSSMFQLVSAIFGFSPGQSLSPFSGQNEFLSALIAANILEPFLDIHRITEIAACIEATIPFRPPTASGLTASELLYERLLYIKSQLSLTWSEEQIAQVVKRAVRLANRDVENFAFPNSTDFLDNTWNLMPETNQELINANSYTVAGYRKSLQKMEGFMNFLNPELVFQRFQGEPDEETYASLVARTRKNLEVAKLYLGIKLVTIAILEALSYRLGRDIPVSTMMGELPAPGRKSPILEQFLPDVPMASPPKNALEQEVLDLLSKGRNRESVYDIKNSPVSTFIIKSVGFSAMEHLLKRSKDFFAGKIESEMFLRECDATVVNKILEGVAQLFDSRKAALHKAG
ncbi:MAG: hypothetical protein F6K32_08990 [Desertifilum sp. SIO1I2]|nr:hypothetical protein [Desertifilum sp. SIO1I2]